MVMKQREETRGPCRDSDASRDLFCCRTTLVPTSTAPCGEDVSEDVLGQPWEETMSQQITELNFCQFIAVTFDVREYKKIENQGLEMIEVD